jgi:hypothetical protein
MLDLFAIYGDVVVSKIRKRIVLRYEEPATFEGSKRSLE